MLSYGTHLPNNAVFVKVPCADCSPLVVVLTLIHPAVFPKHQTIVFLDVNRADDSHEIQRMSCNDSKE